MITQIKDLTLPPQPAQHLGSGLVGQRVSVSVSQHITHTHADNLPHTWRHTSTAAGRMLCCWQRKMWYLASLWDALPTPPPVALAIARVLIRGGSRETIETLHVPVRLPEIHTCDSQHMYGSTYSWGHRHRQGAPLCQQHICWGCGSAQKAKAPCRYSQLFPTGGDIWGSVSDGHAAPAAWGDAHCSRLMKGALCPSAGCSTGPSWESKWVCPQIKQPQAEL